MESKGLLRSTEALARVQAHWRKESGETEQTFPPRAPGCTIALTREAGVPGTAIAQLIGMRLGWPVYDHELVEKIAREKGLRVELLDSIDEKHRSWLEESLEALMDVPLVSQTTYLRHLIETLLSLGAHGECILVEHGAAQILPHESTLRVRLIGRLEDRVAEISRRFKVDGAEAVRKMEEIDHGRARFIRDYFQKKVADPSFYDLLVNASHWSMAECADLIIDALRQLQQRTLARRERQAGDRVLFGK